MKNLLLALTLSFMFSEAALANESKHLRCFTRFFGASEATFQLEADLASSERIENVRVFLSDELAFSADAIAGEKNHKKKTKVPKHKGYKAFSLGEGSLSILLPANVFDRKEKFSGYVDGGRSLTAAGEGESRLLCKLIERRGLSPEFL